MMCFDDLFYGGTIDEIAHDPQCLVEPGLLATVFAGYHTINWLAPY
jgi:hypothetical protein